MLKFIVDLGKQQLRKQPHHRVHLVAVLELLIISYDLSQKIEFTQSSLDHRCSNLNFNKHF